MDNPLNCSAASRPAGPTWPTPPATSDSDARLCPACRRPHPHGTWLLLGRRRVCDACIARRIRRDAWANWTDAERIARLAAAGVGGRFCPDGRPPGYDDPGLGNQLAARAVPRGGLLLCGPVGSHKSHMLAARAADAMARGCTVRVASWLGVVGECHRSYTGRAARHEAEIIADLTSVTYLGLDDVGVGLERRAATENELRLLFAVLDARYQRGVRECVTDIASNLTVGELGDAYDARILRRIRELTRGYVMAGGGAAAGGAA